MVDANFVEYGYDALRTVDSSNDLISFWATNGYAVGVIIAMVLVLFILGFTLAFGWSLFRTKLFPK